MPRLAVTSAAPVRTWRCTVLLAGLGAVVVAAAGCSEAKPRIESVTPRVTAIDWRGVDVSFDIAVKNPLPIALRAPGGRFAIDVGKTQIVSSDAVPPMHIASRDRGIITLPARFEYLEVLALVHDGHKAAEVPYHLSGALSLDAAGMAFEIPFSHDGEIPTLRIPTIEISGLKQGSVGFSGVSVTVSAEIENPNAFPIGMADVRFDLTIADSRVVNVRVDGPNRLKPESKSGIELVAEVGGADAIASVVTSPAGADVQLQLRGELDTPFGKVSLTRE